jgi:uncharacterized protein
MTTALITGASGGIGKAFAEELARRKNNLILVARSRDKLNLLATDLQTKYQIRIDVIVKDLTQLNATGEVFTEVQNLGLTVDLLINNAGFGDYTDFAESDRERQIQMLQLNIVALVDLTHRFLQPMRQKRSGSIINVSSITAFQPMPYLAVYAASKAFILNFSEALWAETRKYGVKILCICPGPTETGFFEEAKFPTSTGTRSMKLATSEVVVRHTLQALEKGDSTVVSGGLGNNVITTLSRFVPRKQLVSFLEKQFQKAGDRNEDSV